MDGPAPSPAITVILATHDRAETLRLTLESFAALDRSGPTVEFVVVDNASTDDTPAVLEEFVGRLPLTALREGRPGKNCALNHALDTVSVGDLVVFTDDDVVPQRDWLRAIADTSARHPEIAVFGGRIEPIWPEGTPPDWARGGAILSVGFAAHDLGEERIYPAGGYPFGPNFWVRRAVFEGGRRYPETVGPRPTNRIMGSETSLLTELAREGMTMLYTPTAAVGHRILPPQATLAMLRRRFYRFGRGLAHWGTRPREDLLHDHPTLWRAMRKLALARNLARYVLASLTLDRHRRLERRLVAIREIGRQRELLASAHETSTGDR